MLFIISSAKLEKLDKLLSPILLNAGIEVTVKHPDVFCDQPLTSQDTVLLMGAKAFSILIKAGLVKSNQKIGSSRERVYSHLGLPFLVTYDPNIVEFMPELIPDIHWDLNLAIRLEVTGSIAPVLGEYVWVDGFIEVVDWLNTIPLDEMRPLVLDLETQCPIRQSIRWFTGSLITRFHPLLRTNCCCFSMTPELTWWELTSSTTCVGSWLCGNWK